MTTHTSHAPHVPHAHHAPHSPDPNAIVEKDLLEHEYDGIREYDNPTPAWWHFIFIATIFFSLFYYAYYTFSPMAFSIQEKWDRKQVAEYKRIFGALGELKPDQETVIKMMGNGQMMAIARGIFEGNCAACHAKDGGGINGVNLTDDAYKNVKQIGDFYNVITKGANIGAMPAWENRLSQNERIILAAYAASLRGTIPASPKAPEGEPIPPWPKP
ncbi:MAG: c-type cytochrome [Phycisphaerales bacterium]|nr:c-type cytochrome [Phycisphaerales bacterium]